MSETKETPEVLENNSEEVLPTQPSQTEEAPINFEDLSTKEKVTFLQEKRLGHFAVPLLTIDDLKYLRSKMQGEYEFTGPQEAFMLMNAYMGIESAYVTYSKVLKEASKNRAEAPVMQLSASAIEGAIFYTGRVKGKGIEQAQRVFRIAMALNGAAKKMREIDELIKEYQTKAQEEAAEVQPDNPGSPEITL